MSRSIPLRPAGAAALLAFAAALAAAPARAGDDGAVALQDPRQFRVVAAQDGWTIYFRKNSLDVWHGNVPYEKMKNGHASFVVTWKPAVHLAVDAQRPAARSAAISYIFSCSPPAVSVFAEVIFYASAFAPREDSLLEQWTASRQVVHTFANEETPEGASWRGVFSSEGRSHWAAAWKKIYAQSCSN